MYVFSGLFISEHSPYVKFANIFVKHALLPLLRLPSGINIYVGILFFFLRVKRIQISLLEGQWTPTKKTEQHPVKQW